MGSRPTQIVKAEVLFDLTKRILMAVGLPADSAAICADIFLEADLRGHSIQGVHHLYSMVLAMRDARANPNGKPRVVQECEGSALVDGDAGPGQLALCFATDLAVEKAKKAGCCSVGVRNCYDVFMLGYYSERIARAGLVGIVMTAGTPLVHPFGGVERLLGTNPISIAVPTNWEHPVLVDFATSKIASGTIFEAKLHGEELPEGAAIGPDGLPTRDPFVANEGANSPLGGHKGYGLGLCMALLAGPLVGAKVGKAAVEEARGGPTGKRGHLLRKRGNLVVAIDPTSFGDPVEFRRAASVHLEEIKSSRKAPDVDEIFVPGEIGFAKRGRRLREGVPIYEAVWAEIAEIAKELNVPLPS